MKTDLYTKVLLTLITIFLGVLASDRIYETAIPKAEAIIEGPWNCWGRTDNNHQFLMQGIENSANTQGWNKLVVTSYKGADNKGVFTYCGRK